MRNPLPEFICAGLVAAAASVASAQVACPIQAQDLSAGLQAAYPAAQMIVTEALDPDSEEPIRQTVVSLAGGNLLIVEQRHCEMYNLSVTLLDATRLDDAATLDILLSAVAIAPEWTGHFGGTPQAAFARLALTDGLQNLSDRAEAVREASEILIQHTEDALPESGFDAATTLYIGIGGQ
jgi:lambda repressor-like predicted transcriptional regulator